MLTTTRQARADAFRADAIARIAAAHDRRAPAHPECRPTSCTV